MTDSKRGHRRSIRLPGYDYATPGAYFITVVTHRRLPLFGEVVSGDVNLSALGRIADQCWRELPLHFPHVELGASVIMPNHIHGILILHDPSESTNADASGRGTYIVPLRYNVPPQTRRPYGYDMSCPNGSPSAEGLANSDNSLCLRVLALDIDRRSTYTHNRSWEASWSLR